MTPEDMMASAEALRREAIANAAAAHAAADEADFDAWSRVADAADDLYDALGDLT